jgi:lipopolysaccharide transport system ATP-binding protein
MAHIRVDGVGKAYKRYPRKWGRLAEWLGGGDRHQLTWILRDVAFDVAPGEAVGVIGFNGAGKSTLLKMIAGTTRPTTGRVDVGGRVSALLELGIGFHPDFTGRENALMAGQLRGLGRDEVEAEMPAIEAFAGIGDYIDQPLRVYSSGMAVRLAFSVATAVRPDILIVDEALAVGDVLFQQKCYERIRTFCDAGTTLLFVSHSMPAVYALCDRALLIHGGGIAIDGKPKEAIDLYNALALRARDPNASSLRIAGEAPSDAPSTVTESETPPAATPARPSNEVLSDPTDVPARADPDRAGATTTIGAYAKPGAAITSVSVLDDNRAVTTLVSESAASILVHARFDAPFADPHVGFQIRDARGEPIFMTNTHGMRAAIGPVVAGDDVEVRFELRMAIAPGEYSITAGIANEALLEGQFREALFRAQGVATFTVLRNLDAIEWSGVCNLAPTCVVRRPPVRARMTVR